MLVRVYLDPRRVSTTSTSAESIPGDNQNNPRNLNKLTSKHFKQCHDCHWKNIKLTGFSKGNKK